MSAFDPSAPGLPMVPTGGLPAASGAGQIPVSDGAGTDYTPTASSAVVTGALDGLYAELPEGDFLVGSGGAEVGAASEHAAAVRAAIGAVGSTVTTYRASDGTAANGAGVDATASITGTGASSRLVMGVSSTSRTIASGAIGCGTWASPAIPRTAKKVTLYLRSTAISGIAVDAFRAIVAGLRRNGETPPASMFLAGVMNAASGAFCGNSRSGGNSASYSLGTNTNTSPLAATDRWLRIMWEIDPGPRVWIAAGATTGSTRPTLWTTLNLDSQTQAASGTPANATLGTLGTADAQVLIGFESYGTGVASSLTLDLALEVET